MNDELLMDNYLLVLKSTVEVYVHGTLESTNNDVRNVMKDNLNEILDSQNNTYQEMVKLGWYPTTNVETNVIKQTLTKVKEKEQN